ncbi:hypothetical protein [Haloferula sp.]|uniref:hypothetical protein n=1 Tax=Haloferula sp. TaxID=2497595 RepID=UPI003C741D2B
MLSHISRISLTIRQLRDNPKPTLRKLAHQTLLGVKATGIFLKSCYVDGFLALVAGHYTRRQAAMIIAGSLPTILGAMMITVPGILFPTPGHQAFFHFGNTLSCDPTSLIPVVLGAISTTLGLRIPLG